MKPNSKREKDAPEALEATEESLDLVAPLVHLALVLPGFEPGLGRWHHGDEVQVER